MPEQDALACWLERLEQMQPERIELGLERMRAVMAAMQLPARLPMPTILVGGTNGKGSAVAYLESMFTAAGYRVGAYTSPHIWRYNERIRIAGWQIEDAVLVEAFEAVERSRGVVPLTYFEFGTLAAVHAFLRDQIDVAVLEVGLGGRLDAVNAFEPDLSMLMSLDVDHSAWLGSTREAIAQEKTGIFRAAKPCVCADLDPPAAVAKAATALGSGLWQAGRDFAALMKRDGEWIWQGRDLSLSDLPAPGLRGPHQFDNAAACVAAVSLLRERLPLDEAAIRTGLRDARLAGRFQQLPPRRQQGPGIILDVAHNPDAARALAANLAAYVGKPVLAVLGMLADKDHTGVLRPLLPHVRAWYCADLTGPRALPGVELARQLKDLGADEVRVFASMASAFQAAEAAGGPQDDVLVFGSFFALAKLPAVFWEKERDDGSTG